MIAISTENGYDPFSLHDPFSLQKTATTPFQGMEKLPAKRGPASILQRQIEQIGTMPRAKQKFITEMLEALIKQQQAS
jgi:hypothetical protein